MGEDTGIIDMDKDICAVVGKVSERNVEITCFLPSQPLNMPMYCWGVNSFSFSY